MESVILTRTTEYLCMDESEATTLVEEAKKKNIIENYSVKQKKATKKKAEHWIVTIKERINEADIYVSYEAE